MPRTSPLGPLIKEAGLRPAPAFLENRQRLFALRIAAARQHNPLRELSTIHVENWQFQPVTRVPEAANSKMWNIGRRCTPSPLEFADHGRVPIERCRLPTRPTKLEGTVIIQGEQEALAVARQAAQWCYPRQAMWTDGSRLDDGRSGCAVAWQDTLENSGSDAPVWHHRATHLGIRKEAYV